MKRTPIKRKTAINRVNRKRKAKQAEKKWGPKEFRSWFHDELRCCVTGGWPVEQHHHPTWGSGGIWTDTVPLTHELHMEYHYIGADTFQVKHDIDLAEVARDIQRAWRKYNGAS